MSTTVPRVEAPQQVRRLPRGLAWLVELAGIGVLWWFTLQQVDLSAMGDTGLVSVLPWTGYLALAAMAVSFGLTLAHRASPRWLLMLYPAVLTVLLFVTPPLLYGAVRYSWTWKHAGIIDYIDRTGTVDPTIGVLGIYHNWPGFFAFNAMLTDLAGLDSALSYAAWAEVFFYLLTVAAAMVLLRTITDDARTVAVGGWLFVLANWVGQGYFSPQALNYVWYLLVLAVLIRWFARPVPQADPALAADADATPGQRVALMGLLLLLSACIVTTHQLTPLMLVLMLVALAATRRTVGWALPVFVAVALGAWVLYVAAPFTQSSLVEALGAVGAVRGNLQDTLIGYNQVSSGQELVSLVARVHTVLIGLLGVAGMVVAWLRGRRDYVPMLWAFTPATLVVFSPYGSEILFRAFMFALPGLVYFAATLLWPLGAAVTRWRAAVVVVVSCALMGTFLLAEFGNDRQYHFSPGEVAAADFVYSVAPPGSLLIEGSRNYPAQFDDYERFTYVPIAREDAAVRRAMVTDPEEKLFGWMSDTPYAATYLIITRSQKAETEALGEFPGRGLAGIETDLLASDAFHPLFRNRDATVFVLAETLTDHTTKPGRP